MKKIIKMGIILVVLLSMAGISSATTTHSPNNITVNIQTDAITTVTITHAGFIPQDMQFTISEAVDVNADPLIYITSTDLEGSLDGGSTWNNIGTIQSFTLLPNGDQSWTFLIRDVPSSSDVGQIDKKYKIYFEVSNAAGNFDGSSVIVDACNTFVTPVPEFPTIALPVAAILGLAFIFQRRREED